MNYRQNGYEVVRGLLGREEAAALALELGPYRLSMPHAVPLLPVLRTMRDTRVTSLVRCTIGREVSGLGSNYYPTSPGLPAHQDNAFVLARPDGFCSVWLALSDIDQNNGALEVAPGSHDDGLRRDFDGLIFRPVRMAAGDAMLLHGDLVHRSGQATGPRPVLLLTYIRSGWPFRAGFKEQRKEVEL